MNYNRAGCLDLAAIKADGTPAAVDPATGQITLAAGTWYVPLGSTEAGMPAEVVMLALHLAWTAALAATITFEWTNFPARKGQGRPDQGPVDVADNDGTAGNWVQDNDATGDKVTPVVGAGNAIANLTVTAGGANAGAVGVQLDDRSARRYRLKLVVTTQGAIRINAHGKLGA